MASKLEEIDDGLITGRPDTEIVDRLADELQKLDLTPNETRILLFLMTHGHSTASEVSRHTGIQRTETYNYISSLLAKGVVFSTFDRPQQYYTLTMQEVIDCLVETKRNALQQMSEKKIEYQQIIDKIISNIVIPEAEKKESYQIVMGENAINAKVKRLLTSAKEDVTLLVTDRNLVNFYHAEITDDLIKLTTKGIHVKLRTPCKNAMEYLAFEKTDVEVPISVNTQTSAAVPINFVIVDNREIILLLESYVGKKRESCGFYTNNISLVNVFKYVFDNVI